MLMNTYMLDSSQLSLYGGIKWSPGGGNTLPGEIIFRSRGSARSCGDGPYFCSRKSAILSEPNVVVSAFGHDYILRGVAQQRSGSQTYFMVCTGDAILRAVVGGGADSTQCSVITIEDYEGRVGDVTGVARYAIWNAHLPRTLTKDMRPNEVYSLMLAAYNSGAEVIWYNKPGSGYGYWYPDDNHPSYRDKYRYVCALTEIPNVSVPNPSHLSFVYKYDEYNEWLQNVELDLWSNGYLSCFTSAYINACNGLPEACNNSILNVLELARTISDLLEGKVNLRQNKPSDVWLSYRYSYLTTQLDIQEYVGITNRLMDIVNQPSIKAYGSFTRGDITFNVTFSLDPLELIPSSASEWLRAYGFKLNLVNAWDAVPYSFVVDWFLHVSDILGVFDSWGNALRYSPSEVWFSATSAYDGQTTYLRTSGSVPRGLPSFDFTTASTKTWFMRFVDGLALFFS